MASDINREKWLDILKGVGIVFVVVGHISPAEISSVIYLFHMPLFFFISGYLHRERGFRELLRVRGFQLMVPYSSYLILLFIFPALVSLFGQHIDMLSGIVGFIKVLVRAVFGGRLLGGVVGVFWFVTCLFLTQIFYAFVASSLRHTMVHWVAVGFLVCAYLNKYMIPDAVLPWNINVVLFGFSIFHMGAVARGAGVIDFLYRHGGWKIALLLMLLIAIGVYFNVPGVIDMKNAKYGTPILGLVFSLLFVLFLSILCMKASGLRIGAALGGLGKASITIMFLHQFVHIELSKIVDLNWSVLVAVSLLLPLGVHELIKMNEKISIVFLGKRKATQAST